MTNVEIAQKVAHMIVALNVNSAAQTTLATYTNIDPDGVPIRVVGVVTGEVVARRTDPYTNKIVEKTAGFITNHKSKLNFVKKSK
jgi:hypothetical protein